MTTTTTSNQQRSYRNNGRHRHVQKLLGTRCECVLPSSILRHRKLVCMSSSFLSNLKGRGACATAARRIVKHDVTRWRRSGRERERGSIDYSAIAAGKAFSFNRQTALPQLTANSAGIRSASGRPQQPICANTLEWSGHPSQEAYCIR